MRYLFCILLPVILFAVEAQAANLHAGTWRGVITLNDGELPFNFEVKLNEQGKPELIISNATERIALTEVKINDDSLVARFPLFDSELRAQFDSQTMSGRFINYSRPSFNVFPFNARWGDNWRFAEDGPLPMAEIDGRWECDFSKGLPDSSKAIAVFEQKGKQLTGTFLTPSGDDRYLQGLVQGDQFKLSAFDGSHLFLFTGKILADGTLRGMFYSGNHWKEPWQARKNSHYQLPDAASVTRLKPGYSSIDFSFPDLHSRLVSYSDKRFRNKALIIQIMGTWCPNCMDESAYYAQLYDRYHDQGLEIVALDFERITDTAAIHRSLRRMQQRFNIHYDLLYAGQMNDIGKALPALDGIKGYPTSIFVDGRGNVRKIYTGINGPATGDAYEVWKKETEDQVKQLIAELHDGN